LRKTIGFEATSNQPASDHVLAGNSYQAGKVVKPQKKFLKAPCSDFIVKSKAARTTHPARPCAASWPGNNPI
jgi:hypothetical protein